MLAQIISTINNAALKEEFEDRVAIVKHKTKFFERKKIAFVSINGQLALNTDYEELVNLAGGELVLQVADVPQADILVCFTEGAALAQSMQTCLSLLQWPLIEESKAYKANAIFCFDAGALPSDEALVLIETLESIAELSYPTYFAFGYEGSKWMRFAL